MPKNVRFEVRLTVDEMREVERMAQAMGVTKSDYARAALVIGAARHPGDAGISPSRLDALESSVSRIGETLERLAAAIEQQARIPTFREWRLRAEIGGDEMPKNDPDAAKKWMLRQAATYHAHTGIWPLPDLPTCRTFGKFAPEPDWLKAWPQTPPPA